MTDATSPLDEREALAAEYALRLLDPAEEARARALAADAAGFAEAVAAWQGRLAHLAEEIAPVPPAPVVWARLRAAIEAPANDNGAGDRKRLTFWRRCATASTGLLAASLVGLAVLATRPEPVAPQAPSEALAVTRVATIASDSGTPMVMLAYDGASGRLYIAPAGRMEARDGVPHLWLVMPGEAGVRLIGAIDGGQATTRNLDAALAGAAGSAAAVAISMEAPGHAPAIDKPDGPVVATGELRRL